MIKIVYTSNNIELANKIKHVLDSYRYNSTLINIKNFFPSEEDKGYVFLSSTGIAIRKTKDIIKDKIKDPFLVVVTNKHIIPIFSSHVGGGSFIAKILSINLNKELIYSTATDSLNKVGVDELCRYLYLKLPKKKDILRLNKKILERDLTLKVPKHWKIKKIEGYRIKYHNKNYVEVENVKLDLLKIAVGVGCRKDIESYKIYWSIKKSLYLRFIPDWRVDVFSTIDLREDIVKEGIKRFRKELMIFNKEYINRAFDKYDLDKSNFVYKAIGVYGVAEPVALLALEKLGVKGKLILKKIKNRGVSVAIASNPTHFI
ncbi:cobalamin biosynthesis protein [Methanocaldococcus sp.]